MDKIVVKKKNTNWFTFSLCYCQTLYPYFNFTSFPIVEDDKLLLPFHFWSILLTPALSILNLFIYQVSLRLHKLCTSVCMINNVTCHNECLNIFLKLTWHMVHHGLFVVRQTCTELQYVVWNLKYIYVRVCKTYVSWHFLTCIVFGNVIKAKKKKTHKKCCFYSQVFFYTWVIENSCLVLTSIC